MYSISADENSISYAAASMSIEKHPAIFKLPDVFLLGPGGTLALVKDSAA